MEYTENIADQHSDWFFCPQRRVPSIGHQNKIANYTGIQEVHSSLVELYKKYLQQTLEHGLKLVKVHRVL